MAIRVETSDSEQVTYKGPGVGWVVEGGTLFIDEQGGTRDWTIAYGPGHWKTARVIVEPQDHGVDDVDELMDEVDRAEQEQRNELHRP